jgi:Holliday junction DNA helicase RuvA
MFNSLTGIITGKFPKQVFIDTNGVEWDLCVPDSNLDMLPPVGNEARIFTWLQHTEQLMTLYGFASAEERTVFLDLLKVDGVGPKGAVKIMSAVSSGRLMDVLEKGDLEMLEKIPGVGKKTAGKMMLTLKGKLTLRDTGSGDMVRVAAASPYADVVMSLASMGYDKKLVEQKVAQLVESLTNDASFAGKSQKEREDILFRRAIVELA